MPRASVADDMEKKRFSAIDIPDPLATSKVQVPKLNIDADGDLSRRNKEPGTTKHGKRQLSDSSRGSIGRKERLRNALTGRSDGSEGGGDQPKEIPDSELVDFMHMYDRSDLYSCKIIKKKVQRSVGSFDGSDAGRGISLGSSSGS